MATQEAHQLKQILETCMSPDNALRAAGEKAL
eukprot:CAMPEP_0119289118 /NCGR_PEP_ID=MMETSP1329-20130426/38478_1 /TAXON_ID=114041 /ORGANISM="Genus nov. species nov., Strain RCC1024" /LENGTH=31 /DNA_ID= /DNA_START= /DNA_END= /DNA_ORIENTATION=